MNPQFFLEKVMRVRITIAFLILPLAASCSSARDGDRSAAAMTINERFLDPDLDVQTWVRRWESQSREIASARKQIVRALELKPGKRIADVGAGTGLFVELFSKAVTDKGRVYAVDISPKFVAHIKERVASAGLSNVEVILSSEHSVKLAEGSVDVVFLCDTYHHFEYPGAMLRSIHSALSKDGQLVVIDFERIQGKSREWVLNHVRAGKARVNEEITQAGFRFRDEVRIDGFLENYFLRFEKQ